MQIEELVERLNSITGDSAVDNERRREIMAMICRLMAGERNE